MKTKLFFIISLVIAFQFYSSLRAQVYSQAPIIISESGEILTDMSCVKFKVPDLLNIPAGKLNVDGNAIMINFFEKS